MNKIKLSVIIPVFNAEPYLRECLDSVLSQSLADLEVLCINDCSTDHSQCIINEYAQKDTRVKLLNNEVNLRAGLSRNRGLQSARGTYIHFLDADDYLEPDIYERLYQQAVKYDLDWLKTKSRGVHYLTKEVVPNKLFDLTNIPEDAFHKSFSFYDRPQLFSDISVVPWNGIYKRSFLEQYEIRFNDFVCVNDRSFYNNIILHAKRIMLLPDVLVNYRVSNPDSLMGNRARNFTCHFASYYLIKKQCESVPLTVYQRYLLLDAELADTYLWYRRFRSSPQYGLDIIQEITDFSKNLDISYFEHYPKNYRWYLDYLKLTTPVIATIFLDTSVCDRNLLAKCRESIQKQSFTQVEILESDTGADSSYVPKGSYLLQLEPMELISKSILYQSIKNALDNHLDFKPMNIDSYFYKEQCVQLLNDTRKEHLELVRLQKQYKALCASVSFKIGMGITWIPRKLKNIIFRIFKH